MSRKKYSKNYEARGELQRVAKTVLIAYIKFA